MGIIFHYVHKTVWCWCYRHILMSNTNILHMKVFWIYGEACKWSLPHLIENIYYKASSNTAKTQWSQRLSWSLQEETAWWVPTVFHHCGLLVPGRRNAWLTATVQLGNLKSLSVVRKGPCLPCLTRRKSWYATQYA